MGICKITVKSRQHRCLISILWFLFLLVFQCEWAHGQSGTAETSVSSQVTYHQDFLGENVFIFDPEMDMVKIQTMIDTIFMRQSDRGSEFSLNRYALLFKPGIYHLDIRVGYYMQVMGLGQSPEDVTIIGAVRSNARRRRGQESDGGHVLTNFWRSVENLTIIPGEDSTNVWGVSQAAPMRRVCVKGNLQLHDNGYASGGFLADSKIEGTVMAGGQQQWFSRNSDWNQWQKGAWNIFSMGVPNAPETNWPDGPYTSIKETPTSREKPYLVFKNDEWVMKIPAPRSNSSAPSWLNHFIDPFGLPIAEFYIAKPRIDNSESLNLALMQGKNLLFTPGIYQLEQSLKVTFPGTIITGLGMPSLVPVNGNAALETDDVSGLIISGILFDASVIPSQTLVRIGEAGSAKSHAENSIWLFDLFFRVGGPTEGSSSSCVEVNSNDLFIDHIWLWRADHGNGVGWDLNKCANGLIVNGDDVTIYGLFNEHHQEYQTLWIGERGRVYFYQSEMPYDPPSVESWKHGPVGGYASYKVADHVKSHQAFGVGIYCVFYNAPVVVHNAIETPVALEDSIHHKFTFWLNGNQESSIMSIINGKGESVHKGNRKAVLD